MRKKGDWYVSHEAIFPIYTQSALPLVQCLVGISVFPVKYVSSLAKLTGKK